MQFKIVFKDFREENISLLKLLQLLCFYMKNKVNDCSLQLIQRFNSWNKLFGVHILNHKTEM